MVTVTLNLDDETYEGLRERAQRVGQPVESLLEALAAREANAQGGVTDEYIERVRQMIETYRPLFRRLAE